MKQETIQTVPAKAYQDKDALTGQELENQRTKFGKVYSLGGNQFQAVTYSEPVHRFNQETEKWEEIDATFRPVVHPDGKSALLEAKTGEMDISCGVSGDAPFVTLIDTKGRKIAWGIEEAAAVEPKQVERPETSAAITVREKREKVMEHLHDRLIYTGILPGVNMICQSGSPFKDEFVISVPESSKPIVYRINAPDLLLEMREDNQVVVMDANGETAFYFYAPSAMDADQKEGKVNVNLERISGGYRLIYSLDSDFLASAAYPVTLDPAVRTAQNSSGIVDTYVCQGSTTNHSGDIDLWVTYSTYYGIRKTFVRVDSLPTLGSNHFITGARLYFCPLESSGPPDGTLIVAREVEGAWTPSTITYSSQPQVSTLNQDAWLMQNYNLNWINFDVTSLARKWYAGVNYGITLAPLMTDGCAYRLQSTEYTDKPYFVVDYSSLGGLEDYLTYDSQSAGRAGTGFVSLHNGNLIFAHSDTVMNGERLPVSVTHYYNSCDADKNEFYMGKGWKTSLHQTLHKELLNAAVYYVYTDGDGTQHYFESANSSNTEYKDLSGLSLKLVPGNPTTITDKGDNVMSFPQITATPTSSSPITSKVLMSKMQDANGNQITISASGLKITSVTDGAGRVTNFDYTNNKCTGIRTPWQSASTCTRFTYSGEKVTQATYEDGKTSTFTYSDSGSMSLLTGATGPEGFNVAYTYTSTNVTSGLPHYVSRATVTAGTQKVSDVDYEYGYMMSKVKDRISGKSLRYHFNENGNQVSVDDELGFGRNTQYDQTGSNANAPINHATERSRMQKVVTNLLTDGLLNDNSSVWMQDGSGTFNRDSTNRQWGLASQKITIANGATAYKYQAVTLTPGKSYTFSAYVRSGAPKAFLRFSYTISNTMYYFDSDPVQVDSSFHRIGVSFTLPTNASATAYCCMMCTTTAGSAWFDCLQLEEGLTMNHFNLLQNSDFSKGTGTLPNSWYPSYNSSFTFAETVSLQNAPAHLTGRAIRVTGLYYASTGAYQQFYFTGNAGDHFSAGGWCSGYNKRAWANELASCRLNVQFSYNGTTFYTGGFVDWNTTEGNWQFTSGSIVAPCDYSYIRFMIECYKQINTADFACLYLYPEQFGAEYVYDAKGNRQSVTTLYGQSSSSQHDSFNNLTSYTAPGYSVSTTYNYGSTDAEKKKHLLLKSISPLGTVVANTYNTYGKLTSTQTKDADSSSAKFIRSDVTYTSDGNYVATQKDGRAKVTTTVTDANKGTVTSVTDPNSQTVNYTYDTLRRVTQTTTVANSKTYRNESVYDANKGTLTQLKHNTTSDSTSDVVYNFSYDAQGRQTQVKVGTQSLSINEYNTNTSSVNYGTLKKVTYGNGATVENDYDDFNRVTGIRYNGATSPRYQYAYNAQGNVAHVKDNLLNRIHESEYDLADRPCRVKVHENGSHVYTGEVEYDSVKGNLSKFTEKVGTNYSSFETTFGYDNENRPVTLSYGSTSNQTMLTYDKLGRVTKRTVKVGGYSYVTTYAYVSGGYGTNSTTPLVASISQTGENFSYTYDNVGNIASVTQNSKTTYYVYDNLGQLIRVNDQNDTTSGTTGTTWVYDYDRGGNILSKKRYAYTTGTVGSVLQTISYTYGDSNWKDKLTKYNGTTITYDAIGNPLSDGTWTYTWQNGRQLQQMSKTGTTASFVYNAEGLRVRKTVNSVVTNYTLHGKNIVHMTQGSNTLHFWYDAQNRPAIVQFNGTKYAYIHNLQGDIVGIIDTNGTEVVKYTYDAWGKVLSTTGSLAATLGTVQPFRYRGYVYDVETGLYYLRSRYYNPNWNRFVNADVLINGNLYTYCRNAPIMRVDSCGNTDDYYLFYDIEWNFENPNRYYYVICDPSEPLTLNLSDWSDETKVERGTIITNIGSHGDNVSRTATLLDGRSVIIPDSCYISYPPATYAEVFGDDELKKGDKGVYVRVLQWCLHSFYPELKMDGIFGNNTESTLKKWRKEYMSENHPMKTFGPDAKNEMFKRFYELFDIFKGFVYRLKNAKDGF